MVPILSPLAILIERPWIAAAVAVALYLPARARSQRIPLAVSAMWLVYGLYEYGMKFRILCSGECNIRADLLLIYPLMVVLTLAAVMSLIRNTRG